MPRLRNVEGLKGGLSRALELAKTAPPELKRRQMPRVALPSAKAAVAQDARQGADGMADVNACAMTRTEGRGTSWGRATGHSAANESMHSAVRIDQGAVGAPAGSAPQATPLPKHPGCTRMRA